MGLTLWILASLVAFAVSRLIPLGRTSRWRREAILAVIGGLAAGIAATGLDFGGWKEPDLVAAGFSALIAFGAIALHRILPPSGGTRRRITK